jgi:ABC-2 type transport system ATP-binding protein
VNIHTVDSIAIGLLDTVKRFKNDVAIAGLNTTIDTNRLTGLFGPDGAGKTTLMRLMAALMHPDEGRVHVKGLDVTNNASAVHSIVGYMPQRFGLYEDLSVHQNLQLYADLKGIVGTCR